MSFEKGQTSTGSLQSASGDCLPKTVNGNYVAGKALNDSNSIVLTVNVTKAGRYTVSTDTVNGYYFKSSGNFTTVGANTVQLKGFGTPITTGNDNFVVVYDTSACSINITVTGSSSGGDTTSGEYFPLTQNSFWTYDDGLGGDTLKTTVTGTASLGGNTYQKFITTYQSGPPNDSSFYRKDNSTGFYYNYVDTSEFSGYGITFKQPGLDLLFLKSSLTTGATWNSDFNATFNGIPVVFRFKYTCTNASAVKTVNGQNFTNLYQITLVLQLGMAGSFQDVSTGVDFYYAKGIGLIQIADPASGDEQNIRYWKVF